MNASPKTFSDRLETLMEVVGSLVMLALLLAIIGAAFHGAHRFLMNHGLSADLLHSVGIWVAVGAACSLVWPLRYWRGMRGHWASFWRSFPVLALTGPFALVLGFPV